MFRIYKILEIIALKYLKFKMWIYYFFWGGGGGRGGGVWFVERLVVTFSFARWRMQTKAMDTERFLAMFLESFSGNLV